MRRYYGTDRPGTQIKVSTGYDIGGRSFLSGEYSSRGYYVYVQPVQRAPEAGDRSETITLFAGFKHLLKEVSRQGEASRREAEGMALGMADEFAARLAAEQGIALNGEVEEVPDDPA